MDQAGPMSVIEAVAAWLHQQIHDQLVRRGVVVTGETLGDQSLSLSQLMTADVERRAMQEIVLLRVLPRLKQHATANLLPAESVATGEKTVRARTEKLVQEPYTPPRLDGWASEITADAKQAMEGRSVPGMGPGPDGAMAMGPDGLPMQVGLPELKRDASGGGAGPGGAVSLIGMTSSQVTGFKVTIPAGSHAGAWLMSGVSCEIGGQTQAVMFSMDHEWRGPNNSRVPMRNLRIFGNAKALAGPQRIDVELTGLSYVFPSGRTYTASASGYVSDAEDGIKGMLGILNMNAWEVAKWTVPAAMGKGAAEALTAANTTTVVGTSTTTIAQTGDKFENALLAAASEGAGSMAAHFDKIRDEFKPTVTTRNGQRVYLNLVQPVVIDVPDEEWSGIGQAGGQGFAGAGW
jgi:hypothetical protein